MLEIKLTIRKNSSVIVAKFNSRILRLILASTKQLKYLEIEYFPTFRICFFLLQILSVSIFENTYLFVIYSNY